MDIICGPVIVYVYVSVCMSVCLSVCHTPMLYTKDWKDRACSDVQISLGLFYSVLRKSGYL